MDHCELWKWDFGLKLGTVAQTQIPYPHTELELKCLLLWSTMHIYVNFFSAVFCKNPFFWIFVLGPQLEKTGKLFFFGGVLHLLGYQKNQKGPTSMLYLGFQIQNTKVHLFALGPHISRLKTPRAKRGVGWDPPCQKWPEKYISERLLAKKSSTSPRKHVFGVFLALFQKWFFQLQIFMSIRVWNI